MTRLEGRTPADRAQFWGVERGGGRVADQRDAVRECSFRMSPIVRKTLISRCAGRSRDRGVDEGPHARVVVHPTVVTDLAQAKSEDAIHRERYWHKVSEGNAGG